MCSQVLLNDRFAAALAVAPAVSCSVPLPPTMPTVKLSKNGLPIPVQAVGGGAVFGRPKPQHRPAPSAPLLSGGDGGGKGAASSSSSAAEGWDLHAEQQGEIALMNDNLVQLTAEYNRLRQASADREARLERLQLSAQLGARDSLDAADELAYLQALRGAAEAELDACEERTFDVECDQQRYDFMRGRVMEGVAENKHKTSQVKLQLAEIDRKTASAVQRSAELVNGCKEAVRQHKALEYHQRRQREQSAASLRRLRASAKEADGLQEWTARQMRESHERVQQREKRKAAMLSKGSGKTSVADRATAALVEQRREKLSAGFDRLRALLGCRTVEETVERIERACADGEGGGGGNGGAPLLGGTVRSNSMVFRSMLDSKVAAEAALMKKVNEMTKLERRLARLTQADGAELDALVIVDHKSHVEEVEARLRAAESKLAAARARSRRCDGRVHEAHAGAQRLEEMLAGLRIGPQHGHKTTAATLTVVRRGAIENFGKGPLEAVLAAADASLLNGDASDDEDDGESGDGGGTAKGKAGGMDELTISLKVQNPHAAPPPADSAAGALMESVPALEALADCERGLAGMRSRGVEAAAAALQHLAECENRLEQLLPEMQLHDARMRIRVAGARAIRQAGNMRAAEAAGGAISLQRAHSVHAEAVDGDGRQQRQALLLNAAATPAASPPPKLPERDPSPSSPTRTTLAQSPPPPPSSETADAFGSPPSVRPENAAGAVPPPPAARSSAPPPPPRASQSRPRPRRGRARPARAWAAAARCRSSTRRRWRVRCRRCGRCATRSTTYA